MKKQHKSGQQPPELEITDFELKSNSKTNQARQESLEREIIYFDLKYNSKTTQIKPGATGAGNQYLLIKSSTNQAERRQGQKSFLIKIGWKDNTNQTRSRRSRKSSLFEYSQQKTTQIKTFIKPLPKPPQR